MWHDKWVAHMKEEAPKMPYEKQICLRSATKPGRQKILTFCWVAPGLPLQLPFRPAHELRCSVQHSARVSHEFHHSPSCSPVCIPQPFSQCTQYRHCVSQKNSLNHIFFCLSHHGTVSRTTFPVPDDDGFKLFTFLVHCASHSTSNSTQIQERLGRRFYSIS